MLPTLANHPQDRILVLEWDSRMEEIRHRAYEDKARLPPTERLLQLIRMQRHAERIIAWIPKPACQSLCHALSIAVCAAF